ncbi:hypothetical protein SALBM135S_03227 [Streptomyces alboniger]
MMPFSGEECSTQLAGRLRAHLTTCAACPTEACEDGARIRRALRAVQTVLQPPEPMAGGVQR